MSVSIEFRALKVPRMNARAILDAMNRGAEQFSKQVIKPHLESVWTDAPDVVVENKGGNKDVAWLTKSDNEILFYNNEGTSIRWALMSNDWRSQTKPGRIPARPGRGHVVIAGRGAMTARGIAPRPGIEGRHWDEQIVKKEQKNYENEMLKAIVDGAAHVWT